MTQHRKKRECPARKTGISLEPYERQCFNEDCIYRRTVACTNNALTICAYISIEGVPRGCSAHECKKYKSIKEKAKELGVEFNEFKKVYRKILPEIH